MLPSCLHAQQSISNYGTITVQSGSQISAHGTMTNEIGSSIDNDGNIKVYSGNFVNNSSTTFMNGSTGWLEFTGTNAQEAQGTFPITVEQLRIENSSGTGVTVQTPTTVTTQLNLVDGIVYTDATNLMTIDAGSSVSGVSDASHVEGPCRKVGNTAFVFPVGREGRYRPADIGAPSLITDHFTAEYMVAAPILLFPGALQSPLVRISSCEYWQIDRTNGNANVEVGLTWDNTAPNSMCGTPGGSGQIVSYTDLRVARHDGAALWADEGNGSISGNNTQGRVVSAGAVTDFSPFTLGTIIAPNTLNQEILTFDAKAQGEREALVSWKVSMEINSNHFIVERSGEQANFESIGKVDSKGESETAVDYQFIDPNPKKGWNYYRLTWYDLDGTSVQSQIRAVYFDEETKFALFPNPNYGQLTIMAYDWQARPLRLELYSMLGELLYQQEWTPDLSSTVIDLSKLNLPSATYIFRLIDLENQTVHNEKIEFINY